jgi:hypothetical protein
LEQLTFLLEEPHANHSALLDSEKDWMTRVATSCSHILPLLTNIGLDGWFGKTSPASCHLTEEKILESSSGRWGNSGMGSHTAFLTLSTLEWPKDADVFSLSDTLETGELPQRFFLSATACQGILRRAEKRGKKLPVALETALQSAAIGMETTLTQP